MTQHCTRRQGVEKRPACRAVRGHYRAAPNLLSKGSVELITIWAAERTNVQVTILSDLRSTSSRYN